MGVHPGGARPHGLRHLSGGAHTVRGAIVLALAIGASACWRNTAPDETADVVASGSPEPLAPAEVGGPAAGPPSTPESTVDRANGPSEAEIEASMQRHFEEVRALQAAVVDGDLAAARERAEWFVESQSVEAYPHAWRPHVARMLEAARAAAEASTLDEIAAASAELAGTCGSCHRALGARPVFPHLVDPEIDDPDAGEDTPGKAMVRHQWSAERLWEGVVGPSSERWRRGAEGFVGMPGCVETDDPEIRFGVHSRASCQRVHALGRRALRATEHEERTRLLGELSSTCAACHQRVDAEAVR